MGLIHDNYVNYLHGAAYYRANNSDQRIGQAYYNYLRIEYPELEEEIYNTHFDCFQLDDRLPGFLAWVQARLDRYDDAK